MTPPTPKTPQAPVDVLLSRALLLEDPAVPCEAAGAGLATRAAASAAHGQGWPSPIPEGWHDSDAAGHDLRTLCEAVVAHTATALEDFEAEHLPAPQGANVLACILQLAADEDGARFWWQYAAGAGNGTASYCLYLHHRSLGETDLAALWRGQTRLDTPPSRSGAALPARRGVTFSYQEAQQVYDADASTPTVLRILGLLAGRAGRTDRPRTELVDAVMDYAPGAVGYVRDDGYEIPVPQRHFAEGIRVILAVTAGSPAAGSVHRPPDAGRSAAAAGTGHSDAGCVQATLPSRRRSGSRTAC